MTTQRLGNFLKEQPFRSFAVHTSYGERVVVRSPEFAWLHPNKRTLFVATSAKEDREEIIDLLHVTKLTRVERSGNGSRKSS
jgi:hypothetical protein